MVMARDGADTIKVMLPARFQEAIDEAAMRMGEIDADAYTAAGTEILGHHRMKFQQNLRRVSLQHSKKSFPKVSYKQFLMQ